MPYNKDKEEKDKIIYTDLAETNYWCNWRSDSIQLRMY